MNEESDTQIDHELAIENAVESAASALDRLAGGVYGTEQSEGFDGATAVDAIVYLARSVGRIASGGQGGPDGLEAVAMALGGHGIKGSVKEAIESAGDGVASALSDVALAINRLAKAVEKGVS